MRTVFGTTWVRQLGIMGLAVAFALLPQFASAQEGIGNPFADAGAQEGALNFIDSLIFWVIITFLVGVVYAAVAYALQGPFPMLWGPVRDWGKMGFVMFIVFQVVVNILRGLAVAAQGKGTALLDGAQYLGLVGGWW